MIKNKKTIKKIQKPIDYDIHLKYRCTNCSQDHWLSYLESSTKNFKVVCDCGTIFKVKRITGFGIRYKKTKQVESKPVIEESVKKTDANIPEDLLKGSISILSSFGYSKIEAYNMIIESYKKSKIDNVGDLVKQALANCK